MTAVMRAIALAVGDVAAALAARREPLGVPGIRAR
jgi:hypothetical protein